eukprot:3457762-Rhodomonas_salina.2
MITIIITTTTTTTTTIMIIIMPPQLSLSSACRTLSAPGRTLHESHVTHGHVRMPHTHKASSTCQCPAWTRRRAAVIALGARARNHPACQ